MQVFVDVQAKQSTVVEKANQATIFIKRFENKIFISSKKQFDKHLFHFYTMNNISPNQCFMDFFSVGGEGGVKLILSDCKLTSIPALYNFLFSCQIIHASNLTLNVYINQYLQHKRHVYRLSQISQQDT